MFSRKGIVTILVVTLVPAVNFAFYGTGDGTQQSNLAVNEAATVSPAAVFSSVAEMIQNGQDIEGAFSLIETNFVIDQAHPAHATAILQNLATIIELAKKEDNYELAQRSFEYANKTVSTSLTDSQLAGQGAVETAYPFMQAISLIAHAGLDFDEKISSDLLVNAGRVARNLEVNPSFPTPALRGIAGSLVAEAKGFALRGNTDQAAHSLKLAYDWGFVDFELAG